jgi:hypothetical protein
LKQLSQSDRRSLNSSALGHRLIAIPTASKIGGQADFTACPPIFDAML